MAGVFFKKAKTAIVEDESLNRMLQIPDGKFPHLMQMKRVVKALEEVAQEEQRKMREKAERKGREEGGKEGEDQDSEQKEEEVEDSEDEEEEKEDEEEGDEGEKEKKRSGIVGKGRDMMREAGAGPNSYMNDYFVGSTKLSKDKDPAFSSKMANLMNNGGINGFS